MGYTGTMKYYVEIALVIEADSEDEAVESAQELADIASGDSIVKESWVNYVAEGDEDGPLIEDDIV